MSPSSTIYHTNSTSPSHHKFETSSSSDTNTHTNTHFDFDFDFDALPSKSHSQEHDGSSEHNTTDTTPTFAGLTKIMSPLVSRTQWDVVFRSMCVSAIATLVLEVVFVAVPWRH
jgi:hypothetical protein